MRLMIVLSQSMNNLIKTTVCIVLVLLPSIHRYNHVLPNSITERISVVDVEMEKGKWLMEPVQRMIAN